MIDRMQKSGADDVMGIFADRLAADGHLTPTTATADIWRQYPFTAEVTWRLVQGLCGKVALCRGHCPLTSGHHFVEGAAQE